MMNDGINGTVTPKGKTAGIIIIADEVLKGQVADINSHYLAKEFYSLGIKLCRISTIPDDLDAIASEVSGFSSRFDYVFTTGGVGPTHDDMTYVGVGQAFGESTTVNPDMARLLDIWLSHKGYEPDVISKMAQLPRSATLLFDPSTATSFPIVNVRNVYIFPGIPQYLQRMFPRLKAHLDGVTKFYGKTLYVDHLEMGITPALNVAVDKFKGRVTFGSYPVLDNLYYSTRLTMDSVREEDVASAAQFLTQSLPEGSLVHYDSDPVSTGMDKIYQLVLNEGDPLHGPVSTAVQKLEEALDKYGLDGICICFNGGKDCTALLHLVHAVVQHKFPTLSFQDPKLASLSIKYENSFSEMEDFVRVTAERYNLKSWTYDGPIRSGLESMLKEHPNVKAVLMGTRRTDPSGHELSYFQMTDVGWPQVMRVSPMLDWTYAQVWQFLRSLTLPYCPIYDKG